MVPQTPPPKRLCSKFINGKARDRHLFFERLNFGFETGDYYVVLNKLLECPQSLQRLSIATRSSDSETDAVALGIDRVLVATSACESQNEPQRLPSAHFIDPVSWRA